MSRSTLIISVHLASRVSLSSPFSSPCYVGSHCSAFLSCKSCLLSNSGQHESTCNEEILHRAQMGQDVYIRNTHVPNIHTYIHIYIYIYRQFSVYTTSVGLAVLAPIIFDEKSRFNSLVWGLLTLSQLYICRTYSVCLPRL